ncbi:lipopolysaccharide assembly protein LapB [Prochlorococcus sp. MIT 1303]|uniref:tetratricopeptide repeat protein n=1 Tax=Prochlorococcus sp. MIT 1303 TaxID=1723647 RepID=UPI0007B3D244|nr:tetratricopeptide repeat protein [Prochlorococcus sp. MIT 1303]KZR61782.1 cellulose synthase subunit BcsC [Prochlorococcus sp. MIT 1303]
MEERSSPKPSNPLAQQALIAHKNGELGKASTLYLKSIAQEDANDKGVLLNLGVVSKALRNDGLAEKCYKTVLKSDPSNLNACINLSSLCVKGYRYQEGKEYSLRGLENNNQSHQCLYNLGVSLAGLGDLEEAAINLKKSIRAKPDFTPAYMAMTTIYCTDKKYELAKQILQNGIKVNPESADIHETYAYFFRDYMQDLSSAIVYLKKALALNPKNHMYQAEINRLSYMIDDA